PLLDLAGDDLRGELLFARGVDLLGADGDGLDQPDETHHEDGGGHHHLDQREAGPGDSGLVDHALCLKDRKPLSQPISAGSYRRRMPPIASRGAPTFTVPSALRPVSIRALPTFSTETKSSVKRANAQLAETSSTTASPRISVFWSSSNCRP